MINIENDNLICLALKEYGQVGPKTFQQLLMVYGHPGNIYDHSAEDIASMTSINMEKAERLIASQNMIDDAYDTQQQLQSLNISVVSFLDDGYPESLRQITDPPVVLYTRGDLDLLNTGGVAIVGTTQADQDGIKAAVNFAREFSANDQVVISGLALGIDSAAHLGSLKSGGKTIAVLGCGLMNIYPEENESLAGLIAESGTIISEYDIHADAIPGRLISRNRLIAGLSGAVLIVQVGEKRRGELHAAQAAIDQGKPVFLYDPEDQYDTETLLDNMAIRIKSLEQIDEIMSYIV